MQHLELWDQREAKELKIREKEHEHRNRVGVGIVSTKNATAVAVEREVVAVAAERKLIIRIRSVSRSLFSPSTRDSISHSYLDSSLMQLTTLPLPLILTPCPCGIRVRQKRAAREGTREIYRAEKKSWVRKREVYLSFLLLLSPHEPPMIMRDRISKGEEIRISIMMIRRSERVDRVRMWGERVIFHPDCRSMIDEMKMMNDGLTMEWVNGMYEFLWRRVG